MEQLNNRPLHSPSSRFITWHQIHLVCICICICLAAATSSIGSTCLGHKFFPLCSFERSSLTIHPIPLSNILHIDKLNKSTFKTCMYWFPSQMAREMLWSPITKMMIHHSPTTHPSLCNFLWNYLCRPGWDKIPRKVETNSISSSYVVRFPNSLGCELGERRSYSL